MSVDAEVARKLGYEVELRHEGKISFYVPKLPSEKGYAPSDLPVFFNPVSKPNRDITILLLKSRFKGSKIKVVEALAGTGVRSVRIARETDVVEEVVANDISAKAVQLIKVNVELNGVGDLVKISNLDANELLSRCGRGRPRYDYVDIDPAGTPAHFLENGFRGCIRGGILAATATDMAALAGAKAESCIRKYDAKPLRSPFSKEIALRILLGFAARTAARLGLAVKPVLSFQRDHYARIFVEVERGKTKAKKTLRKLGWISYCPKCMKIYLAKRFDPPITTCPGCGSKLEYAGPIWLDEYADKGVVSEVLEKAREEVEIYAESLKTLEALALEDTGIVGYFPVNSYAERLKTSPIKPSRLIERLREMGYKATPTHIDPSGIKTDAPLKAVEEVFKEEG
ncbi:MAG: tRNA (guanine(10)-N(2))-dimethyltransferase [Thaumarchaeota archaeon]|nr:tRNA (guanine(10)-N(2))-dimethyltransferase [Nitrososphaerota archaeon]